MSTDPLATMREQLAAAQADNRALREALGDFAEHGRDCILARYEGGRPTDGGGYEMRYAGKWYETRPVDKTPPCTCGLAAALSRAPGSRESLREWGEKVARRSWGAGWADAYDRCGEPDIWGDDDEDDEAREKATAARCAAIVARLLGEEGANDAE